MAGPACLVPRQSVELYNLCRAGPGRGHGSSTTAVGAEPGLCQIQSRGLHQGGTRDPGLPRGAPLPPQAPLPPEGIEEVRRALAAVGAL